MTPSRRIFCLVVLCLVTWRSQHVSAAARLTRSTENEELKPVTTTTRAEIVFIVTPEQPVTSPMPMERGLEEATTLSGPIERELEESTILPGKMGRELEDSATLPEPMERELEESATLPGLMEQELEESVTTTNFGSALAREQNAATTKLSSAQESRVNQTQHSTTTTQPGDCEEKSATVRDETTSKTVDMKHPTRLLDFLKGSSKPRSRVVSETQTVKPKKFSESHTVNPKTKTEFGARVSAKDSMVMAGHTPRGARFFASASSFLSGLVPAVDPPIVRGGRAACAGACHVNPMANLATLAAETVQVQVSNVSRRFSPIRRRPQVTSSVTNTTTEVPATLSTIRAPLPRLSARRRQPSTTPATPTIASPAEEQVITTTTPEPEPDVTTTRDPRLFMFRKFKILQRTSTPNSINFEN